jgi:hypothetical protein
MGPDRFNPMLYMTHLFTPVNPAFPSARHRGSMSATMNGR